MEKTIESMKLTLLGELDEWVGFDVPDEGTEDYDAWQLRLQLIEDIESYADVYDYLNGDDERAKEFFEEHGISDFKSLI